MAKKAKVRFGGSLEAECLAANRQSSGYDYGEGYDEYYPMPPVQDNKTVVNINVSSDNILDPVLLNQLDEEDVDNINSSIAEYLKNKYGIEKPKKKQVTP